jgi:hypothetical protein
MARLSINLEGLAVFVISLDAKQLRDALDSKDREESRWTSEFMFGTNLWLWRNRISASWTASSGSRYEQSSSGVRGYYRFY